VAASVPVAAGETALTDLPAGAVGHVTCTHQADLSTGGDYADPAEPLPACAVVVVAVEVLFPDGGRVRVTETVPVEASGGSRRPRLTRRMRRRIRASRRR
jgi:hypothetical protein